MRTLSLRLHSSCFQASTRPTTLSTQPKSVRTARHASCEFLNVLRIRRRYTTRTAHMRKTVAGCLPAIGMAALAALPALQAQGGITIGSFPSRLTAGPDYATDVFGDPWDMGNPEEIGQEPRETSGWGTTFTVNGLAGGTMDPAAGFSEVSFLYSGFYDTLNPGRTGRASPIAPTKYPKLSV